MKIFTHSLFKHSLSTTLFLLSTIAPIELKAAVQKWDILKEKSTITFTATQNNSPVSGEFKTFSGEINFDVNQLSLSNVSIVIDMNSVTTSYPDIANTLKTQEWFDVKTYAKATFKATSFNKLDENSYQAKGILTLRDKSSTLIFPFELKQITPTTTEAKGEVTLQRSTFGIGRGEWVSTNNVKDEVKLNFTLTAIKK